MRKKEKITCVPPIESVIRTVRGHKVLLDEDLALIYGIATKFLNRAVKRNAGRFPEDFVFQLTAEESIALRCQNGTSNHGRGGRRYLPYVFTEYGAIMAANVLNSRRAVQLSVFVVRAFIKMREQLLNRAEMEKRLTDIEKTLLSHDTALRNLYQKIRPLLLPPPDPPRKRIGFQAYPSEPGNQSHIKGYVVKAERKSK